jgi:hypothetical protein
MKQVMRGKGWFSSRKAELDGPCTMHHIESKEDYEHFLLQYDRMLTEDSDQRQRETDISMRGSRTLLLTCKGMALYVETNSREEFGTIEDT